MKFIMVLISCFILCLCLPVQSQENTREESIHKPIVDLDGDLFSPEHGFRGCDWRGKDGSDLDPDTYPGVYDDASGMIDNNCNGIYGWPLEAAESHEYRFCKNSQSRGVVIFGDSAAAAFHLPKKWIQEAGLTDKYKDLFSPTLMNEFDWPQKSWATGFDPEIKGESVYMKMRARNLCNHRDYQNLAVNGAKARSLKEQVENFSRRQSDKPVLAFIGYIGNDVCKKALDQMTKPEEFKQQMLEGLDALDQKIPPNSKVVLIGLVDGRILWNVLHDRMHPLGITYGELYEFLHNMNCNPCRTWLTSDSDSRDQASARARDLSAVLEEIVRTKQYRNFEMIYFSFPLKQIFDDWANQGGDPADLIEAVDGFHPSHTAHRLMAKAMWRELTTKYPSFIGPVNPYNAEIAGMFGDQGGH